MFIPRSFLKKLRSKKNAKAVAYGLQRLKRKRKQEDDFREAMWRIAFVSASPALWRRIAVASVVAIAFIVILAALRIGFGVAVTFLSSTPSVLRVHNILSRISTSFMFRI